MTERPGRPRAPHGAIVLLGPPGAGKGTVARRLEAEHGFVHVDMGQLLRQRASSGDRIGDRISIEQARGVMVPKELVLTVLRARLDEISPGSMLVLDGFPRTTAQVAAADDGRVPLRVDLVVWLDIAPGVATDRLAHRRDAEDRADDYEGVVATRLGLVGETVDAVRALYERRGILEIVEAQGSIESVYEQVRSFIAPIPSAV